MTAPSPDLADHYRAYLAALNEHRFDDLVHFVADDLTYNGSSMTLREYQDARRHEARILRDHHYALTILVADDDHVAARLEFRSTPTDTFLGFEPTGQTVTFAEHVFYTFADRRIVSVTSLVDVDAIRRQLGADG